MSIRHIIGESFLDYFHFDSKLFRTLRPLIFKPGQLTMEFMTGKRKSFVEPFKLFLVISVIYFLLLPLNKESAPEPEFSGNSGNSHLRVNTGKPNNITYTLQGISLSSEGQDTIRKEVDTIGMKRYIDKHFAKSGWGSKLFIKQVLKIMLYSGQSFKSVLEHTASKMIFLLIPVFALLLKLCYLRSKRLYFEHLIFSLHIHAFVFFLLFIALLIEFLVPVKMIILILIFLLYLYFALKRNYQEPVGKTLWKLFQVVLLYCIIALPVFFFLLILVSVFLV